MKNILRKTVLWFSVLGAINPLLMAQSTKLINPSDKKSVQAILKTTDFKLLKNDLAIDESGTAAVEKAMATDSKVNVSFCAAAREINVRGWQRDEVRVLINDAAGDVGFKVMERSAEQKPRWIIVQGFDAAHKTAAQEECLRGDSIEIEVPANAKVGAKSREGNFIFDSIASVNVSNIGGNIEARNITQEIEISSLSGNLLATDSSGRITLKSVEGDVVALRLKPNDFSDALKFSSTSGNVILRNVSHKNIEAGSNSGEVAILDSLVRGGNYDFNTTSGTVLLALPIDFSFQIKATINARGSFRADFPVSLNTQKLSSQSRLITATNGSGETAINLTTFDGSLQLQKK